KAALLTSQLPESAAAAERAEPLELVPQSSMSIAHLLDRRGGVGFPITISCDVGHAQVDAKRCINVLKRNFLDATGQQQIPVAAMEQQIAFTLASCEHRSLAFATDERERLSAIKCPDRERRVGQSEREDAFIVGDRGERAKCAFGLL